MHRARVMGLCLVAFVASAAAEPKPWTISPPAGWADHSPAANAVTTVDAMKAKMAEVGGSYELGLWEDDAGSRLTVLYMNVPAGAETGGARVRGWEAGARGGVNKDAVEISYKTQATERLLVAHQENEGNGVKFRSVRMAGLDKANALVGIQASCAGSEAVCGPALASLRLDDALFRPLASSSTESRSSKDPAYEAGYIVGVLLAILGVVALLGKLTRRRIE